MVRRPFKIAISSTGELYGGVEQFIYTFAKGLYNQYNVSPLVILFNKGVLYEKLMERRIPVEVVELKFKYSIFSIFKIAEILRKYRIDIVHTHGYKATILAGVAAKMCRLKIIKTEHGRLETTEGWGHYKMVLNTFLDRIVSLFILDAAVFVSEDIQSWYLQYYKNVRRAVIHNGIEPIGTSPKNNSKKSFDIGIVGRVTEVKGHLYLLKAMQRLTNLENIKLCIFGEGPLEAELKEFCDKTGLSQRVTFMGFRKNIYEYLNYLDLLVIPSLHEGLPYILLEAMYLKVPIVATNVGGLKEVLKNGEDAILVPPKDGNALARAIEVMYSDQELRFRMAQRAFDKVCEQYLCDMMVKKYMDLYNECLSNN